MQSLNRRLEDQFPILCTSTDNQKVFVLNLIEAARRTISLLEDLKEGGAENPELKLLQRALARIDRQTKTPANKARARRAKGIVELYATVMGDIDLEATVADLIADLGHFSDHNDIDFLNRVRLGIQHWFAEKDVPNQPEQIDILRDIDIEVGEPRPWTHRNAPTSEEPT